MPATLKVQGRFIRLYGVVGVKDQRTNDFSDYLGGREVVCDQAAGRDFYRCRVDEQDLSRVVLFNGGGRAAADATPDLKAAEKRARAAGLGIWSGNVGETTGRK